MKPPCATIVHQVTETPGDVSCCAGLAATALELLQTSFSKYGCQSVGRQQQVRHWQELFRHGQDIVKLAAAAAGSQAASDARVAAVPTSAASQKLGQGAASAVDGLKAVWEAAASFAAAVLSTSSSGLPVGGILAAVALAESVATLAADCGHILAALPALFGEVGAVTLLR